MGILRRYLRSLPGMPRETEGDFGQVTVPDDEHQQWLDSLKPGDLVCDCRFRHLKIVTREDDDVLLSDGSSCSLASCCPPDHAEENPVTGFGELDFEHGSKMPKHGSDENF